MFNYTQSQKKLLHEKYSLTNIDYNGTKEHKNHKYHENKAVSEHSHKKSFKKDGKLYQSIMIIIFILLIVFFLIIFICLFKCLFKYFKKKKITNSEKEKIIDSDSDKRPNTSLNNNEEHFNYNVPIQIHLSGYSVIATEMEKIKQKSDSNQNLVPMKV